jgi:type IX secretion system PorP/SprF family membrane protein
MGLEAGFINPTLDWDKLVFFDQLDPEYGLVSPGGTIIPSAEQRPENISRHVFDASMGIMLYSSQYYAGVSIKHLNNPDLGFFNEPQNAQQRGLPMRITLHAGAEFPVGGKPPRGQKADFYWSPSVLFVKQGPFFQLNGGAILSYKQVFGGLFYRHAGANGDAVVFNLGTRFDKYRIGYSYDFTVSRLYNASGGSHEISFGVLLNPDKEKIDISDCFQLYR